MSETLDGRFPRPAHRGPGVSGGSGVPGKLSAPGRQRIVQGLETPLVVLGVALIFGLQPLPPAFAQSFPMGNHSVWGDRSVPADQEPELSRAAVLQRGLQVKSFLPTDHPVVATPLVGDGVVYVGDMSFATFGGSLYAFDVETGDLLWKTVTGAILASPLLTDEHLYAGTLGGTLLMLDRETGAVEAAFTPNLRPFFDSIWAGPVKIRDTVVFAINPNDEFPGDASPGGLGALIAVDARTLAEAWRFVPVDNDVDEPPIAGEQYGGAGIWNNQITYSPQLDLIFVSTGQNTYSTDGRTPGGDSVFAVHAGGGTLAWQTQMVDGDIWNANLPYHYDSLNTPPVDTDLGDSPAFFWVGSRPYVAVGSKRGYFYVLDALDGTIVNGAGRDVHGFRRGLEVISLPGPGLDGGFNLDSGYFRKGSGVVHFGIVSDYAGRFDTSAPYCYAPGYGVGTPECPGHVAFGHLVLIDSEGTSELGRYSNPNAQIYSPLHLDGMVFVREAVDLTTFDVDKLLVVDVSDPGSPALISNATVDLPGTRSIGAHVSIAGGLVFTGSGAFSDQFGSPSGLYVIGLGPQP
jgi:outer membrane protein assembly factor BamB